MKTVLGYHDKQKEYYGLLDKTLPLLIQERYEPFLITTRELLMVRTTVLDRLSIEFPIRHIVRKAKNSIGLALMIPGILTSLIYITDFATAIAQSQSVSAFLPAWLTNLTFWLAVWGAMILWHETYKSITTSARIAPSVQFSEHDVKTMKKGDLGLSKRTTRSIPDVLQHDAYELLFSAVKDKHIDMHTLFWNVINSPRGQLILDRLNIDPQSSSLKKTADRKHLPVYEITAARSLLVYAAQEAVLAESPTVDPEHLLIALFKVFPALTMFLQKKRLNIELLRYVAAWIQIKETAIEETRIFNPRVPYIPTGGIARSWIYGYTFVLSHYSRDLTQELSRKGGHYGIGHETELEEVLSILSKASKHNVLLVGESGTGKTSIAKGIAERLNRGTVPPAIKGMRVIQLDINGLIAAGPAYGNLETLVQQTMQELERAGNTILFIDEIQEIVAVQGQESKHSLAGILLPYIMESSFPIVGTITYADYKKFIQSRGSLQQSFEMVEIHEVTTDAAFNIILTMIESLERQYQLKITFPAILSAVELAQRYVHDRKLPDSAVNIIEAACASAHKDKVVVLTERRVAQSVSQRIDIPVEEVTVEEATRLMNLETDIKSRVIGQDEAVHQIVEALKRSRTGIRDPRKPIGSFLFLGPTGVGKTYLAKTVGDVYFGEKHELIRLDMSEFKDISSISRFLGSAEDNASSGPTTTFLDLVQRNPYSVVLLDEMEKSHPHILDLFLQVLDEGHMTNAKGETVSFDNTIIIATSNIGSKTLLDTLERDNALFEESKEQVLSELRDTIRVEFLNRFDKIVVFSPHSSENLAAIAELLLKELKDRLKEKEVTLDWDESLPQAIARNAFQPGLGARPLRRYIQDNIESLIAQKLLEHSIKPGDSFLFQTDFLRSASV